MVLAQQITKVIQKLISLGRNVLGVIKTKDFIEFEANEKSRDLNWRSHVRFSSKTRLKPDNLIFK